MLFFIVAYIYFGHRDVVLVFGIFPSMNNFFEINCSNFFKIISLFLIIYLFTFFKYFVILFFI